MMNPLWWHWVVLGIALMLLELAVPAFFVIWFGAGAVIVGLVLLAVPALGFAWQIVIWSACSVLLIWLWFKVFRPNMHKTRAGMSRGALVGEIGGQLVELAQKEVELARTELASDVRAGRNAAIALAVGGVVVLMGATLLLVAAVLALAQVMAGWLAALVVAAVVDDRAAVADAAAREPAEAVDDSGVRTTPSR